jgi:hypothetical protein
VHSAVGESAAWREYVAPDGAVVRHGSLEEFLTDTAVPGSDGDLFGLLDFLTLRHRSDGDDE